MKIITAKGPEDVAIQACQYFTEFLARHERPVVCLPAGKTPLPFYERLRERFAQGRLRPGAFSYVQLDEYKGLPENDKRLFSNWLAREVLDPLSIPRQHRLVFNSMAADDAQEISRFKHALQGMGAIDLAVIGIGGNGHVGFNEPYSEFDDSIRTVALAGTTLRVNAAYWKDVGEMPKRAYTLGLSELLAAKNTLLLCTGEEKADILRAAVYGPVSKIVPASYIQRLENVTVLTDQPM